MSTVLSSDILDQAKIELLAWLKPTKRLICYMERFSGPAVASASERLKNQIARGDNVGNKLGVLFRYARDYARLNNETVDVERSKMLEGMFKPDSKWTEEKEKYSDPGSVNKVFAQKKYGEQKDIKRCHGISTTEKREQERELTADLNAACRHDGNGWTQEYLDQCRRNGLNKAKRYCLYDPKLSMAENAKTNFDRNNFIAISAGELRDNGTATGLASIFAPRKGFSMNPDSIEYEQKDKKEH